jgi:hypothetical protein
MVNNYTNINKINNHFSPKGSLNSDGQQLHQYHQNKRFPSLETFFCFDDIDGIVDHHCLNFLLF